MNVPNKFINNLPSGTTFGDGPFREVRLSVDGQIAGVIFPYATCFSIGYTKALRFPDLGIW
jgi:hypothetical protein